MLKDVKDVVKFVCKVRQRCLDAKDVKDAQM